MSSEDTVERSSRYPVAFDFEGTRVRVVVLDDTPWWVLADVAPILGYDRPTNATRCVDDEDKRAHFVSGKRGEREVTLINESGLYSLMLRSRQPDARRFKRWVTGEVLPALRRTGSYSLRTANPPGTYAEALRALADEIEARERAEQQTSALEPAATAWTELARSRGNYSLRQVAFILNQSPGINTGQNRLMKSLVEFGMVSANGLPYATHAKHVELRPRSYLHPKTGERQLANPQIRLTLLGIQYVHRRLGGTGSPVVYEPWD
jgi:anti-repressor protein